MTDEHFDFLKECNNFDKQKNPKKRKKLALKIYNTYICPTALRLVNIPYYVTETVDNFINNEDIPLNIFDNSKDYVLKLIALDSYIRYISEIDKEGEIEKKNGNKKKISF